MRQDFGTLPNPRPEDVRAIKYALFGQDDLGEMSWDYETQWASFLPSKLELARRWLQSIVEDGCSADVVKHAKILLENLDEGW